MILMMLMMMLDFGHFKNEPRNFDNFEDDAGFWSF